MRYTACFPLPCAILGIRTDTGQLLGIDFLPPTTPKLDPQNPIAEEVFRQLLLYQENPNHLFDLPILLVGTPFQIKVWRALQSIAPGTTKTYQSLANELGTSPRAIGGACGKNPIAVIIPCHRVTASYGLGGFMQGAQEDRLVIKRWLLRHENTLTNFVYPSETKRRQAGARINFD